MEMNRLQDHIVITDEKVLSKIYLIRGHKVMIDKDLSELYGVETKRLKEQVKRNIERFPEDFMFELIPEEYAKLKNQTDHLGRGEHSKYLPFAFTEHGVLMLSSVLNSDRSIKINIQIVRVYVRLREMIMFNKDILDRLKVVERKLLGNDNEILLIFEYLKKLEKSKHQESEQKNRQRIGFYR